MPPGAHEYDPRHYNALRATVPSFPRSSLSAGSGAITLLPRPPSGETKDILFDLDPLPELVLVPGKPETISLNIRRNFEEPVTISFRNRPDHVTLTAGPLAPGGDSVDISASADREAAPAGPRPCRGGGNAPGNPPAPDLRGLLASMRKKVSAGKRQPQRY
jgi:hypothetical protein